MASRFLTPFGGRGLLSRDPFLELHREVNRLFDDSLRGISDSGAGPVLSPKIDVCPTDDGWEITAELPGVDEKDIDLRLDGDLLTISGEKRDQRKDEQNRLVERSYGSFTRSIQLPFAPDPNKVTADSDKGVLKIRLPKSAGQDRSKRISIGSSGQQTIEAGASSSGQPAVGKDWQKGSETGSNESALDKEQAEQGQGAPA
jgi:HSP20 family protein